MLTHLHLQEVEEVQEQLLLLPQVLLVILVVAVQVDYVEVDNLQQQELLVLVVQEPLELHQIHHQQQELQIEVEEQVVLLAQDHQALVEMVALV